MKGLNTEGRITNKKSLTKHVCRKGIIATRFTKWKSKHSGFPFATTNGIGQENPCILRIRAWSKEGRLSAIARIVPSKQGKHSIFHIKFPQVQQGRVKINVCICDDSIHVIRDMLFNIGEYIIIGQSFSDYNLFDFMGTRNGFPFTRQIGFID